MKDCCGPDKGYDLIVVGAGSAGFSAAITAAEAGRRVALIGHGTIGGTCVNVGCVPSKAMIRAAQAVHDGPAAARFPGIGACRHAVDWGALVAGTEALVAEMRAKKYAELLPQYAGIDYIDEGPARLVAGGVAVAGRQIEAPAVIVATGSRPRIPDIPGIDTVPVMDSTALLFAGEKPASVILLGGGYIGVELAQMAARLGVEVTLLARSRLLPRAEPEISQAAADALRADGVRVETGLAYRAVRPAGPGVEVEIAQGGRRRVLTAAHLVVTAGRVANTEGLGLDELGIATDPGGAIRVGPDMATSRRGVWAAGDVTDRDRFVYMAAHGGKVAASNALGLAPLCYDNATMPWVVFTDPQIAGVGLTEAQARDAGHEVKVSVLPLDALPRAAAARDSRGTIKLVADAATDRLLGGQIAAPEGADSIQTLAMALKMGMTASELGQTIFPYLTTVEGLKLAAQTFDRDVAMLSCCAG